MATLTLRVAVKHYILSLLPPILEQFSLMAPDFRWAIHPIGLLTNQTMALCMFSYTVALSGWFVQHLTFYLLQTNCKT